MLFLKQTPQPDIHIGLWKIEEDEDFFHQRLPLSAAEFVDLSPLKGARRLEWLACRWLLHEVSGHDVRMPLAKDAYSKPFFEGESENRYCSLTHAGGFVGVVIAPIPCGCDLEVIDKRLQRVAPKFVNELEQKMLDNTTLSKDELWRLCFVWCAKEAMYKAYGVKEVDFKKHLTVDYQGITKSEKGFLQKGDLQQLYDLKYIEIQEEIGKDIIFLWCVSRKDF
jgi:4'-phosphopantetheinyl transferase